MFLVDLEGLAEPHRESGAGLDGFRREEVVRALDWPDDVLEQWLYDHAEHGPFVKDYGHVELSHIQWHLETLALVDLVSLPTGESEGDLMEDNARLHAHWVRARAHLGVLEHWQTAGTWKRPPLLIERRLVRPEAQGLQVLEGRTRVGVLRGRARDGCFVAAEHRAWVGRAIP